MIEVLHSTHPGVSRMESLARSYVWWPLMYREIERKVKDCPSCQQLLNGPVQAPLHPRELPECAWSHVHVDYAGPYEGLMFLVLVNTYSKWMEVVPVCHATSQSMIEIIWIILPHVGCQKCVGIRQLHRLPRAKFQEFMSQNSIHHVLTSLYHLASNGLAERADQSFKANVRTSITY